MASLPHLYPRHGANFTRARVDIADGALRAIAETNRYLRGEGAITR